MPIFECSSHDDRIGRATPPPKPPIASAAFAACTGRDTDRHPTRQGLYCAGPDRVSALKLRLLPSLPSGIVH
jgi:hypothetical protein